MKKTSNKKLLAEYGKIWKKGPEVRNRYSCYFWNEWVLLRLSRNRIKNQENTQNLDSELAEKCRKALEKHYGSAIPRPEVATKR